MVYLLIRIFIFISTISTVFPFLYSRRISREVSSNDLSTNNEKEYHGCLPFLSNIQTSTISPTISYKTFEVERLDAPIEKVGLELSEEDITITNYESFDDSGSPNSESKDEVVEECLQNINKLSEEIVNRLKNEILQTTRLIKKLTKQQKQYCLSNHQMIIMEYRQCPRWREERIFHYYKLMKMTYCADYNRWPKASQREKRTVSLLKKFI